jgi:hypothetical protein
MNDGRIFVVRSFAALHDFRFSCMLASLGFLNKELERFDQHRDAYRAGKYSETQLRNEFLNPFFEALGWRGHAQYRRRVRLWDKP